MCFILFWTFIYFFLKSTFRFFFSGNRRLAGSFRELFNTPLKSIVYKTWQKCSSLECFTIFIYLLGILFSWKRYPSIFATQNVLTLQKTSHICWEPFPSFDFSFSYQKLVFLNLTIFSFFVVTPPLYNKGLDWRWGFTGFLRATLFF